MPPNHKGIMHMHAMHVSHLLYGILNSIFPPIISASEKSNQGPGGPPLLGQKYTWAFPLFEAGKVQKKFGALNR